MNKGELICAGLMVLTLTKTLVEVDKQHINPRVADHKTTKQYDFKQDLIDRNKGFYDNLKKLEAQREAEEAKRREEEAKRLKEEQEKKAQEEAKRKKQNEVKKPPKKSNSYNSKEVLLEVSFYHDDLITASGTRPAIGRTIACPPEVPFGSIVVINGKEYICEDRGGYIKKVWSDKYNNYLYRVDVFVSSEKEAYRLGRHVVKGTIKYK